MAKIGEAQAVGAVADFAKEREIQTTKRSEFTPTTGIGRFWKSLHPAVRNGLVIAGAGLTLFGLYKGYKAYSVWVETKGSRAEVSSLKKALKTLADKGIKPSYPDSQYKTWATELETAFQGYGTSYDVVKGIANKLNNDADVLKLQDAYGVKTISSGAWNPAKDYSGSLSGVLVDEIGNSKIAEINNILKKHGLTKRF